MGERFRQKGRMLPDGVVYVASWVEDSGATCFQLMETDERAGIDVWISRWSDLVDFEVFPVLTSADFWARAERRKTEGRA